MSIGSGVFDPRASENRGVPLTRLVALTTVLHYRADCDIRIHSHSGDHEHVFVADTDMKSQSSEQCSLAVTGRYHIVMSTDNFKFPNRMKVPPDMPKFPSFFTWGNFPWLWTTAVQQSLAINFWVAVTELCLQQRTTAKLISNKSEKQ